MEIVNLIDPCVERLKMPNLMNLGFTEDLAINRTGLAVMIILAMTA